MHHCCFRQGLRVFFEPEPYRLVGQRWHQSQLHHLAWALRISSGVSKGIYKSVVQSDGEFLNIGVGDRQRETLRRQPQVTSRQGDGVHEGRLINDNWSCRRVASLRNVTELRPHKVS